MLTKAYINFFSCKRSRIVQLYSVAKTLKKMLFFICTMPLTNRKVTSPSPAPMSTTTNRIEYNKIFDCDVIPQVADSPAGQNT